jgi:hypothetical protein
MMTNLVEEAMARDLQLSETGAQTTLPTTRQPFVGKMPSRMQGFRIDVEPTSNPSVTQLCGAPATVPLTIPLPHPPVEEVTTIKWPFKRAFFRDPGWSLGAATMVILLGAAGWISVHQRTALTMEGGARIMRSVASEKHAPKPTANKELNEASGTKYTNATRSQYKTVQVGPNEVDYLADDVTIRHFTKPVPPSRARSIYKQFDIGDDVTVRVFNHKAAGLPENRLRQERRYP